MNAKNFRENALLLLQHRRVSYDIGKQLEDRKVRAEKYYEIGYDKENGRYILAVIIPWICWYHRYYLISKEEYEWYETAPNMLDLLADECYQANTLSERFIHSDAERDYNPDFYTKLKVSE